MNKKGFTLIEIIVCIAILAVISIGSVIGINYVTKNIRISKLKDLEKEIMLAAKIYLETNNTAQEQLYKQGNAVVVPLNVLVNEGLLDLSTTDLKLDDIKDEYVLTGRTYTTDSNGCVNVTSTSSWNMSTDNPLYICTKSDGSITLSGDAGVSENLGAMKRSVYYPSNTLNYAYYNDVNTLYRIYYLDTDDSIVLVHNDSFGNTFNGKTQEIGVTGDLSGKVNYSSSWIPGTTKSEIPCSLKIKNPSDTISGVKYQSGESVLDLSDVKKLFSCREDRNDGNGTGVYISYQGVPVTTCSWYWGTCDYDLSIYKKIKLKSCMKITKGNGSKSHPYKIEDKCTS